jgi:hypothetical protein
MNLKTTLALIVLAGASVLLWWYGNPPLPRVLERTPRPAAVEEKGTRDFLDSLHADKIQRFEIHAPSGITEFTHKADGQWGLPGNWPVRRREVEDLVALLTSLRSRFGPQPIHDDKDLHAFGLDHPPVTVTIRSGGEEHTLAFGEQETDNLENRFSRDTYVRLDRNPEVVRLAPGLVAALDKPTDYYQERRLFEKESISGEDRSETVEQLQARSLTIEDKKADGTHFTLVRSGKNWKEAELSEPVRDRLNDEALKALLAGVFDLWAERFVPAGSGGVSPWLWHAHAYPDAASLATDLFFATQGGLLVRAGLTNPERIITAKNDKGDAITLLIGSVSSRRQHLAPAPQAPGMPPGMQQQRMVPVTEEYRYAKLQYNDQVFEIKDDKLKDVFVALDKLRDSRIVRFNSSDARRVEIKHDSEDIALEKDKDTWQLLQPFSAEADNTKVTDLLNKLSDLQAHDKDILDKDDPKKFGFDKPEAIVKITVEEESKSGETKEKKTRTLTVRVGKHDTDKKKLYVMADDWPRINVVDDSLAPLVGRSALAYRGKRLFDFNAADVAKIDIDNQGKIITLDRSHAERGNEGAVWRLDSPVKAEADASRVDQLLADLGHLEAAEFVTEKPKREDLEAQYGLGKAPLTVRIEFTDKKKPAKEVRVGKTRGGKGGYFARVGDGGPVFAIKDELYKQLTRDSLSYRPQRLWQLIPEEIESLRIGRAGQKEYVLTRSEKDWKISGPFEANALAESVQKMTAELVAPKVESYKAHEAKDLAEYGLDKPALTVRIKPVLEKNDKEHTLLIGKPVRSQAERGNEGALHYAKRGNDAAIFTIGDALVRAADRSALDLLDTKLLNLDAAKVERLHSQAGDKPLTLERSHPERGNEKSGWQVTESPAGAYPADTEATASLSAIWSELRAQRFADYGKGVAWAKYGLDKPAVRVTVKADKAEHVVELGKPVEKEPGARYARVDKGAGVAVLSPETTRVLERSYLDYVRHDLLKFDAAAAAALQRSMETKALEVAKKDDGWNVVKPVKEKADDQVMQQLFEQLSNLRAERIAAYPVKDLQPFGLDKPAALVTIKLKGDQKPSEHILKLGKSVGKGGERFALVDDGKAVAVLSASLSEQLTGAPLAFRDRTIARVPDADRLQLERGPRHAVFRKIDGTWKLTEPLQGDAEQDLLDDFLHRLTQLRAAALVVEKPDAIALKKYGLDRPEVQWRVQSGDKEVLNLLIGNKETKGERRYAYVPTRSVGTKVVGGLVFLLDARLSQKVLDEYRPRTVWTPPLDAVEIESLNYRYKRTPFMLEKAGSSWQAVGRPSAKINTASVEDTLAALAGLKLSRYAVDKGANLALFGLDEPELVLEIGTRSGKRVLRIGNGEGSSKGRYARIQESDHGGVFVLDEETCMRLMRDLSAFSRPPARSNVEPAAR